MSLTLVLILLPMLASVVLFTLRSNAGRGMALTIALAEWLVSLYAFSQFTINDTVQFIYRGAAFNIPGTTFSVGMDGISLLMVLLTTTLTPLIILSFRDDQFDRSATLFGLVLLMEAALVGVFVALDGFVFYVFWEMALIPIYFICLIWGGEGRGRITLKFFIYTLAGSLLMLVALVYLANTNGGNGFGLEELYAAGRALPAGTQSLIFWALFLAFAIKMPVFPFHTWQPDTYTVAPAQGTMLLSGIMLKMGIYGAIRWLLPIVPAAVQEWGMAAVILSVIGIIYASCIAIVQRDMKRLVAYSSIAHVGLISAGVFTVSLFGIQGAMIQMLSHGIVVFGMFYVVEIISQRTGTRNLAELGGIRNAAPIFTTVFIIIMLGSVALPLTSGFPGEFMLISSVFRYKAIIGAIAGLTIILGAVYMLRSFQRAMSGEAVPITTGFADLSIREKVVLYTVVIIVIGMGVYPAPLLEISEPAVTRLVNDVIQVTASVKP
jgi:NADH-quinone oxidoreductase subunit M